METLRDWITRSLAACEGVLEIGETLAWNVLLSITKGFRGAVCRSLLKARSNSAT